MAQMACHAENWKACAALMWSALVTDVFQSQLGCRRNNDLPAATTLKYEIISPEKLSNPNCHQKNQHVSFLRKSIYFSTDLKFWSSGGDKVIK